MNTHTASAARSSRFAPTGRNYRGRDVTPNGFLRRRIPWYSRIHPIYRFRSLKNQNTQWCESRLEFDHLYWLEWQSAVWRYQTQPVTLAFRMGPRVRRYSPDLLIHWESGDLSFREIKSEKALERNPALQEKYRAFRGACYARGVGFDIAVDVDIYRPPFQIIRTLYHYAHTRPADTDFMRFAAVFQQSDSLSVREAYDCCSALKLPRSYVLSWMWHGQLAWPIQEHLTPDMPLSLPAQR